MERVGVRVSAAKRNEALGCLYSLAQIFSVNFTNK